MNTETSLPGDFAELEPFVDYWAGETSDIRWNRRSRASMEEIQGFYDAMLPHAEPALQYLEAYPLDDMPEDAERLLRMVLALVQASVAVELHKQPRAINSDYPHALHIRKGPWPQG